jgi:nitroreductase
MKLMKNYVAVILIMGGIGLFVGSNARNKQENTSEVMKSHQNAVITNIHNRKSVRNFIKSKPVPKEDLLTLVKAGMAAPSAVNLQPWQFIIVTERTNLDKLQENLPYAKMLLTATAAIVVCGDVSLVSGDHSYWVEDCSAATQNILLVAESMGLGAVWTAVYPNVERENWVCKCLELPTNIRPLCVIPIGYPADNPKPKNKFKEEKIHYEKW